MRDVSGDLERVGSFLGHLAAQQEQILERIDLIESVTQTEVQLLEAQSELERQLAALRGVPDPSDG